MPLLITIHSDISPTVLLILPISPRYFDNDGWVGDKEQYDGWDKLQASLIIVLQIPDILGVKGWCDVRQEMW